MHDLVEKIRHEVERNGLISFARFMELSLYCPDSGYYEQLPNSPGRRGDFLTSVSVGTLFGELLAFRFAHWFDHANPFQLVESGAHDGRLAHDILNSLEARRPDLLNQLEYWILEPSARRQQWQKSALERFNARIRWFESWDRFPEGGVRGIIFSNELLDAMPVHRLGWDAREKKWFEWAVGWDSKHFVWQRQPIDPSALDPALFPSFSSAPGGGEGGRRPGEADHRSVAAKHGQDRTIGESERRPPVRRESLAPVRQLAAWASGAPTPDIEMDPEEWERLRDALPHNFTIEVSPAALTWWKQAASALTRGHLLTFDYGLSADELLLPYRAGGTLRAYHRHRLVDDLLANVGQQDLTAHVNFSALQRAGQLAGLKTEGLLSQAEFLTRIAEMTWTDEANFGEWNASRKRQFQTLTHPEHFGRAFKVLWQTSAP